MVESRVVNGSVLVWVHSRPGTGTVKEKMEPDLDPEPVSWLRNQNQNHLSDDLDPGPNLGRE